MTECECTCCEHAPVVEDDPETVPFVKWTDQEGNTYITVPDAG